ncbi:hypothetical protein ACJX0J_037939, partial [Zea mays]
MRHIGVKHDQCVLIYLFFIQILFFYLQSWALEKEIACHKKYKSSPMISVTGQHTTTGQ